MMYSNIGLTCRETLPLRWKDKDSWFWCVYIHIYLEYILVCNPMIGSTRNYRHTGSNPHQLLSFQNSCPRV